MPVYKDAKSNTWFVKARYKDWTGATKNLMKRGFALKREALEWEASFFSRQSSSSLDMTFNEFYTLYKEEMSVRLKESTWDTKCAIIESKILPFFKNLRIRDISSKEVIRWQNEMLKAKQLNGKPYSQTYLKTIHNQLSAIFNYAMRFTSCRRILPALLGQLGKRKGMRCVFGLKTNTGVFLRQLWINRSPFIALKCSIGAASVRVSSLR